jgi:hypothetical protein
MPLFCSALKATTPPATTDCVGAVVVVPHACFDISGRRAEEQERTLWERLRTACCVGRLGRILGTAGVIHRARREERIEAAARVLMFAVIPAWTGHQSRLKGREAGEVEA